MSETSESLPDRAELDRLLETYFVGPVDRLAGDRLQRALAEVCGSPARRSGEESSFRDNGHLYFGDLWIEDLARGVSTPDPRILAVWLAVSRPGFPEPRPYCPTRFVGTWLDRASSWDLAADGAFRTDLAELAEWTRWRVHRQASDPDHRGDVIWVYDGNDSRTLRIEHTSAAELHLELVGETASSIIQLQRRGFP